MEDTTKHLQQFHTKYRPHTLAEFQGNIALVESLQALLAQGPHQMPRAFLFSGPSGCGKTTLARMVVERLTEPRVWQDETGAEVHQEAGTEHRINVSDDSGVDVSREIIAMCNYAHSGNRVFLMEECHRASKEAQDALLTTLEEPPKNTFFVFATSEPAKVREAVMRRVQEFRVAPLPAPLMLSMLKHVCAQEGVPDFPEEVLKEIAQSVRGRAGQALTMLQRVIDLPTVETAVAAIQNTTEVDEATLQQLCQALLRGTRWSEVAVILERLYSGSSEPESLRFGVLGYMNTVMLRAKPETVNRAFSIATAFGSTVIYSKKAGLTLAALSVSPKS